MKRLQRSTGKNKELLELEKDLKTFKEKLSDLDKVKDPEVKSIIEPMLQTAGMAFLMQALYRYFGVKVETIDKIQFKSPVQGAKV